MVTRLSVAPSSSKNTASESPPSDCPLQAPEPLSYRVYAWDGVKVAPEATVIGLLRELVVGGVGKTLVAVRRCNLQTWTGLMPLFAGLSWGAGNPTYGSAVARVLRNTRPRRLRVNIFEAWFVLLGVLDVLWKNGCQDIQELLILVVEAGVAEDNVRAVRLR